MRVEQDGKEIRVLRCVHKSGGYVFDVDDGYTKLNIGIDNNGKFYAGYLDCIDKHGWEEASWFELLITTGISAEAILEIKRQHMSGTDIVTFLNERRKSCHTKSPTKN